MIITIAMIAVLNNEVVVRDVYKGNESSATLAYQSCQDERLSMMDQCMVVVRRDADTLTMTNLDTGYQLFVKSTKEIK